jgi:death-on-curing protein
VTGDDQDEGARAIIAWDWIREDVIFAMHDRQIAEHGGLDGVKDMGAVRAALARPQQQANYGDPAPDAADLAAAYAYGLVRGHGFSDGNKRIAWLAARLFLLNNNYQLQFDPADAILVMLALAAGNLPEADLAQWFRARLRAP